MNYKFGFLIDESGYGRLWVVFYLGSEMYFFVIFIGSISLWDYFWF